MLNAMSYFLGLITELSISNLQNYLLWEKINEQTSLAFLSLA